MAATLAQKIWNQHLVGQVSGRDLLYVDLHLVHQLSPQAFGGLELRGLPVRRPDQTVATMDHNVPTGDRSLPLGDSLASGNCRCCGRTARGTACRCSGWDRRGRASSTSSGRNSG